MLPAQSSEGTVALAQNGHPVGRSREADRVCKSDISHDFGSAQITHSPRARSPQIPALINATVPYEPGVTIQSHHLRVAATFNELADKT